MRLAVCVLLLGAGCGRMGFDDNMDPMDPDNSIPKQTPPTAGLIAFWDFENLSPTGAMSQIGADDAQCSGADCPTAVTGVDGFGVAARFDGTQSCLRVPALSMLDTESYTISLWAKLDTLAIDHPMMMRYNGGCASPSLRSHMDTAGHAAFDTADAHQYAWTGSALRISSWQQIAVRWDGVNQSVFVDGVCSCNNNPPLRLKMAVNNQFTIGCDDYDGKRLAGNIDSIRIYDHALTNDEMASLAVEDGRLAPMPIACPMQCNVTPDFP